MNAHPSQGRLWLVILVCLTGMFIVPAASAQFRPVDDLGDVAFHYGAELPLDELRAFDLVVIDPARTNLPDTQTTPHTRWFARIDLRPAQWRKFKGQADSFVVERIQPLLEAGYQGIMLDDHAELGTPDAERGQAMKALLITLASRHPDVPVLLRNHISLAQTHAAGLAGVVVDSLYHGKQNFAGLAPRVPAELRNAVLGELHQLQKTRSLPVIALDYCVAGDKACRKEVAGRLLDKGLLPYVTVAAVNIVGQGKIEVMPRKILVLQALEKGQPLDDSFGALNLAMPLNYLGYDLEFADLNEPLPEHIGNDRYAGIVLVGSDDLNSPLVLQSWLLQQIGNGMRVAVFNSFGFSLNMQNGALLDLEYVPEQRVSFDRKPEILFQDEMLGFEAPVISDIRDALGVRAGSRSRSLLRLKAGSFVYDAAAITPWGGFVIDNNSVVYLDGLDKERWVINPMLFLQQALQLPQMPVPDVTTENGRRLFFTHVDGDGFLSYGEFSGTSSSQRFCSAILRDEVFRRYPLPMSMSVIQAELTDMNKKVTPELERIARTIFALPNVELASHTYSHPYFWSHVDPETGIKRTAEQLGDWFTPGISSLNIPGYEFDIDREIFGSIDYINRKLAPKDKQVRMMFWSGDAYAPKIALQKAAAAGVLNINAGNTTITRASNTWTQIGPYGIAKGKADDEFQVYAAVMNENVYTNDWTGPFYGFRQARETFELTDKPFRFKPINIYYHSYSASKPSSLKALHSLFEYSLQQDILPIYTSEYIQRVLDWRHVVVARDGERWKVRSGQHLRQLRWPGQGVPDLAASQGVTGYLAGPGGLYVHMGDDQAVFSITARPASTVPRISQAAGFVRNMKRAGRNLEFEFGGYYQPVVSLDDASQCRFRVDGKSVQPRVKGSTRLVPVSGRATQQVVFHKVQVDCE